MLTQHKIEHKLAHKMPQIKAVIRLIMFYTLTYLLTVVIKNEAVNFFVRAQTGFIDEDLVRYSNNATYERLDNDTRSDPPYFFRVQADKKL